MPPCGLAVADNGDTVSARFQFTLRQLLLAVTLLAACLGAARWCYLAYLDPVLPVAPERDLVRRDGLDCYLGKRISFCGRYQRIGGGCPYEVVWFGNEPIAVTGIRAVRSLPSPVPDGVWIAVTGRLARPPNNAAPALTIRRRSWRDEYWVWHDTYEQQLVVYFVAIEEASAAGSGRGFQIPWESKRGLCQEAWKRRPTHMR